jgi:hypothetical protein
VEGIGADANEDGTRRDADDADLRGNSTSRERVRALRACRITECGRFRDVPAARVREKPNLAADNRLGRAQRSFIIGEEELFIGDKSFITDEQELFIGEELLFIGEAELFRSEAETFEGWPRPLRRSRLQSARRGRASRLCKLSLPALGAQPRAVGGWDLA